MAATMVAVQAASRNPAFLTADQASKTPKNIKITFSETLKTFLPQNLS